MLTIDYGGMGEAIYSRRPGGTVRAYWKHSLLTGAAVYARFGRQDITADVSFDSLEQWGRELGWKTRSLGNMSSFLGQWDPESSTTPSRFSEPDGAGESFMVLEQEPC
jgi:SAM-dependent MidA family methyltransferase